MTTLGKSDSTTSLSKLNTEEPVCHFCQKEMDTEEGLILVDAKQFLDCKCHITTHLKCWGDYIQPAGEIQIGCPQCQKPIAGWRKRISIEELNELDTKHKKNSIYYVVGFLCIVLVTVGFVIGFTLRH